VVRAVLTETTPEKLSVQGLSRPLGLLLHPLQDHGLFGAGFFGT
jgi:hypothetical protein